MRTGSTFFQRPVQAFMLLAFVRTNKLFAILTAIIFFTSTNLFSQAPPLSVVIAGDNVSCNGGGDGAAFAIISGGTPDYTYSWSNGATDPSISDLTPGVYCVTVTDAGGNVASSCYTITQPAALTVEVDHTEISCIEGADGTATIFNLRGGTVFALQVNSPYAAAITSQKAAFGPTTYDVTADVVYIQDNAGSYLGCSPYPAGSLTGKIAMIDRGGPSSCTFALKVKNAQNAGAVGVIMVQSTTGAPLFMTGTDPSITIPSMMISRANAAPIKALLANSEVVSATLNSGGYQYLWSNDETTSTITGLAAGAYTLTVTDFQGCTAEASTELTDPPAFTASASGTDLTCYQSGDGTATASVSGGNLNCRISYLSASTSGRAFGVLPAPPFSISLNGQNFVACNTGHITDLVVNLGFSLGGTVMLRMAQGVNTNVPSYTELIALPAVPGNWMIHLNTPFPVVAGQTYAFSLGGVAGLPGWAGWSSSTVSYPNGDGFTETGQSAGDFAFEVRIAGTENFPLTYSWSNGETTASVSGLDAGTYDVEVTDIKGCTATASVTLTEPEELTIDAGPNKVVYIGYPDSSCVRLQASATGGTPPYALSWSNGSTEDHIDVCPTQSTVYSVTITDANDCTFTDEVQVCVFDVRCGNNLNKVNICHATGNNNNPFVTLCIAESAASAHFLEHQDDQLGECGMDKSCEEGMRSTGDNREQNSPVDQYLGAFPNPFTNTTKISFMLDEDDFVSLKVFDISGREVANLFEGSIEAGNNYEVTFDGSQLNNGMFLLKMNTGNGANQIRKLILNN